MLWQTFLVGLASAWAAMGLVLVPGPKTEPAKTCAPLVTVGGVTVWKDAREVTAIVFQAGMTIDVDGAPTAYHPSDRGALGRLAHAGRAGRWWGLVTKDGEPVVQGPGDPAPGYFLSMTSLQSSTFAVSDPRRYVDASTIPYVALPESVTKMGGIRLGDIVAVVNSRNGKVAFAIHADHGPKHRIGEGSVYLANQLRDIPVPDALGTRRSLPKGIVYVVFPGSGNQRPKTREQITGSGAKLFERWGGKAALETCPR